MNQDEIMSTRIKYYLSIMVSQKFSFSKAVSVYHCDTLMKIQQEQFLINDGDQNWLRHGLKVVPYKIQRLDI